MTEINKAPRFEAFFYWPEEVQTRVRQFVGAWNPPAAPEAARFQSQAFSLLAVVFELGQESVKGKAE